MQIQFTVPDMSCGHCKAAIEGSLGKLGGVKHSDANPDTKLVDVDYDENKVSVAQLTEAIEDAGYTVAS